MKLNALKFGLAWAGAFAVVWMVAGLLVMSLPGDMMDMGGAAAGSGPSGMHMNMGIGMFLTGLIWWAVVAGVTGWLVAVFYNMMTS